MLEGAGDNRDLALELVKLCCEVDGPRLCRELKEATSQGDFGAIEQAAHGLKGLVGEFHASSCHKTHHDPMHDDEFLENKLNLTRQIFEEIEYPIDVEHGYNGKTQ